MTVRIVHRPARITKPVEPPAEVVLAPPPPIGEGTTGFPLQSLLPIVGSLSSITMIVLLRNNPVMVVVGAVILVVALVGGVGMAFTARGNAARQRRLQRERYLDYLEETRATVRAVADAHRTATLALQPEPGALVEIGANPARRWERRPGDPDFLRVRIGVADLRAVDVRLPPEQNPVQPFDPVMKGAAQRLVQLAGVAQGMPAVLDLERGGEVSIVGERAEAVRVCRAIAAQIGAFHSPDDVHVAAVVPESARDSWRGLDLLPHASAAVPAPGAVAARRVAPTLPDLLGLIGDELRDRIAAAAASRRSGRRTKPGRLILFIDEGTDAATPLPRFDSALDLADLGITVVHVVDDRLKEPSAVMARVTVTGASAVIEYPGSGIDAVDDVAPDPVSPELLEVVARPLAGLRLTRTAAVDAQTTLAPDVTELLGIADVDAIDLTDAWRPRPGGDFLRVPIGVDDRGAPVLLDLKESAQLGMGPHGICIGATGSGKSELLRTLILGLALTHSPDDLSMILVDYKGGAAFAPFAGLPHVAGIIDNLADDPQLTQRARESIQGEVVRRQRLLKDAGNAASIGHYRQLRREQQDLPALPHLFLVIDEFGELLTAEPDFVELLLTIGRIGRSIGVHLLLSSQRIEGGRLRGLDTYLSYRIGLRTFSESESAVVLDTPDAFHLPAIPGYGYLKVDTSVYTRFRAGYVSGPAPVPTDAGPARPDAPPLVELPPYDLVEPAGDEDLVPREPAVPATGRTLVQAAAARLSRGVARTRPVWLPPLPPSLTLGGVLSATEERGGLRAPLGLLDDPSRQRQAPWLLDLTRSGGHISITGAPQSGRSTFLRTLAASLAFTHSPREVSVYGMDLTGGGLTRIEAFPHVGGVATRGHRERLSRLLEELTSMLAVRERVFREHGLDSLADMRRQHADGRLPELPSADVVLLVDGLGALRTEFEDLEPAFGQLLERGGSFGIHVVVTLSRWNELRLNLQGLIGTRLELKLNDPADSQVARKLSSALRADEPGRVLTDEKLFAQVALPLLEEVDDTDIGEALERIARENAAQWGGPGAAPIRLLPEDLAPSELPDALDEPEEIPFGLRQDTMAAVTIDLAGRDPHLLVLGDSRCGKSTVLRGLIQGAIDRHSPEELVIGLMDARGDLAGDIPDDYLGGHATSGRQARLLAESIASELEKRAADRAASGPRILVIADDFDILAAGGSEPLRPLLPYLASARDLRLNVVVSRPVAGASRAMFDVALQGVRDTGGTALIMSGDRAEGQLLPKLYAEPMVAGRGRLARRGERPTLVQVARFPATEGTDASAPPAPVTVPPTTRRRRR
ncbi:type VII secretion protein EccCa [Microbacterium sp. NPDC057407]|uniref:type VII secretion protein EccCa n=1 Tax=Microbacterium sp. NPDC057407 TaxID=3346120 RepID=UPI003670A79B